MQNVASEGPTGAAADAATCDNVLPRFPAALPLFPRDAVARIERLARPATTGAEGLEACARAPYSTLHRAARWGGLAIAINWLSWNSGSPLSKPRSARLNAKASAIRCVTMHDHGGLPSSWHADDALSRMLRWGGLDFVACKECMARQWPIRTRARHPDRTGCAVWTADPSHPYSNPNRTAFEPASSTACTTRWKERSAAVLLCRVRAG